MDQGKMPVMFVGHGSPLNAIEDNRFSMAWSRAGAKLPKPRAILSISAHWVTQGTFVNDEDSPRTVHDMYGFPQELYDLSYPAPGSPALAQRVLSLVEGAGIDDRWGIDHGTWSVLHRMFPAADIPVVQMSVDATIDGSEAVGIGRKLSPLRDEGVLIMGSGDVVHNLGMIDWTMEKGYGWAERFDDFVENCISTRDIGAAADDGREAGERNLSVPTPEHFLPLLYVLGASDENDAVDVWAKACVLGALSMTSYTFTPRS